MSIFIGRNVDADTREVMTIGKVELNMRPHRTKVYVIMDDLNQLTNHILSTLPQETDERNLLLEKVKDIKRLVNGL